MLINKAKRVAIWPSGNGSGHINFSYSMSSTVTPVSTKTGGGDHSLVYCLAM